EASGAVKIMQRLERGVGVGAGELRAEALVEGVVEDAAAGGWIADMFGHHRVPFALHVEHHRRELKRWVEPCGAQAARIESRRFAAQARQAERVAQASRRIDRDNRGIEPR